MTTRNRRRAIIVGTCHTGIPDDLDELLTEHHLEVVFTIFAPSAPKLATLITVSHILEHNADVVVIAHLTATEVRAERPWRSVAGLADILTTDGGWIHAHSG